MTPDPHLDTSRADKYAADAASNASEPGWCATGGCKHRTSSAARLCPVCADIKERGR